MDATAASGRDLNRRCISPQKSRILGCGFGDSGTGVLRYMPE